MDWNRIHITDKSGRQMWSTDASPLSTPGALREMEMRLSFIQAGHPEFSFIDPDTAEIYLNGLPYEIPKKTISNEDMELLRELGV